MNSSLDNSSEGADEGLGHEREIYLKYAPAYIYCMYLIILWLVIGTGNILSFIVWISPRVRKENSSAVYLAALSVADLSLLVFTLLVHLHYMFNMQPLYNVPFLCEIYSVPYVAAQYMSPLLVLAFTVERWIAICFPFKRDTLCTTGRACIVVAGLAVFTLCLTAVHGTMFEFDGLSCQPRIESHERHQTGVFATDLMMSAGVPLLTLLFNVLVIRELRHIDRRNKALTVALVDRAGSPSRGGGSGSGDSGSTNFKATTAMLLSVSFFLIFTTLPAGLVYSLQFVIKPGNTSLTDDEMGADPRWRRFFGLVTAKAIIDQVSLSHYACNIFIYIFTGKVFRRHLHRQLLSLRLYRFIIRLCCRGVAGEANESAIMYSVVRHSIHVDQTTRTGLDNGAPRSSVAYPPRARRQSARSSASTAPTPNNTGPSGDRKNGDVEGHLVVPS